MKISVVVGTRPEIIKMSPLIKICEEEKLNYFIIHTNQHFDKEMDEVFFKELNLPKPKYNLRTKSGSNAKLTGNILIKIEKVLIQEKPEIVLALGDTDSVLAAALTTKKLHFKFGHIEAGLRSRDMNMPEELNRIMVDHISDQLYAPTETAKANLISENISEKKIFVTGNTIVDAVYQNISLAKKNSEIMKSLGLKDKEYFLLTFHREENVDNHSKFKSVVEALKEVGNIYDKKIVFSIHPRTQKMAKIFGIRFPEAFKVIEPVGYLDMLMLTKNAELVLTDSGGMQEEACILRTPCVTLRENTERPETIEIFSNILAGTIKNEIVKAVEVMLGKKRAWKNPYGDGRAGKRIMNIVKGGKDELLER